MGAEKEAESSGEWILELHFQYPLIFFFFMGFVYQSPWMMMMMINSFCSLNLNDKTLFPAILLGIGIELFPITFH